MGDDKGKKGIHGSNPDGPVQDRGCTDIICIFLFIGAFIAMLAVASLGWKNGNPSKLTSVFDGSGKCCGDVCDRFPEMSKYKYLYVTIPHPDRVFYHTTCVEKCPDSKVIEEQNSGKNPSLSCNTLNNYNVTTCAHKCDADTVLYDYNSYNQVFQPTADKATLATYMTTQTCLYQTKVVLNRVCFPTTNFLKTLGTQQAKLEKSIESQIDSEAAQDYIKSLSEGWPIILASVFIAIVVGFIYMIFIRLCAGVMVWLSIIVYHLLLAALAATFWQRYKYYNDLTPPQTDDANNQKYIAIILFALLGLSIIIVLCCFNKIRLAVAILKTAADYVRDVMSALAVPPVFALITACFWAIWLLGFVYLYSWGTIEKKNNSVFGTIKWEDGHVHRIWYFIFMGLWVNAFIQACCQFILVSAPSMWYFAQPDGNNLHAPILTSVYRLFRYHFGSIAFGSLLVAIIQFVRLILEFIDEQAKKAGWGEKQPFKCFLSYLKCISACFERFIKFINKNAYIQIAITGDNFCRAARDAMDVIWKNAGRAAIINGIGGTFIFIGQFLISLLCTFICYLILTNADPYKDYNPFLPTLFIFIITYTIAVLFMSIYGSGVDAIFLCFCHDEENAKAKNMAVPAHCPTHLQEFFDQKVVVKNDNDKKVHSK